MKILKLERYENSQDFPFNERSKKMETQQQDKGIDSTRWLTVGEPNTNGTVDINLSKCNPKNR